MPDAPDDLSPEELKDLRKNASQTGLLLGAIALVAGSLLCLGYLLWKKPWKFKGHLASETPPPQSDSTRR